MRKHRWFGPLTSLLENSKEFLNPFESLLNDFYSSLVVERNWDACESLLSQAFELGYFDKAVHREKYVCEWEPLRFLNGEIYPCMRGGHQMVLDEIHRKIYMFGGWSGTEDLDDLWAFDLSSYTWSILFDSCEKVGGPSARSCHHMAIDAVHQKLFVFGKYVATENRDRVRRETNSLSPLSGELFVCDLNLLTWERICSDTATAGGPPLLHDHQMVFDPETRILYFVGGRMLFSTGEDSHPLDKDKKKKKKKKKKTNLDSLSSSTHSLATTPSNPFSISMDEDLDDLYGDRIMFSGDERRRNDSHYAALSYASVSNLRSPPQSTQNSQLGSDFDSGHHLVRGTDELKPSLFSGVYAYSVDENTWSLCLPDRHRMGGLSRFYSRIGHSIAFDSNKRFLYIFGGQRGANEFFSDLYQYDLDRSELWPICYNSALCGGPERGFTHKMAYDSIHHEIVFCLGLSQGSGVVTSESLTNAVWIFDITSERWKYVPVSENCKKRPIPRYAAQFLYDPSSECYYFHGGNGGPQHGSSERLDDMWRLRIQRPSCESIFRNSLFRLRKLRYLCMVRTEEFSSMDALSYLQEKVSAVVNVNSVDERDEFARLSASFFEDTRISQDSSSKWDEERECVRLFQSLSTILQERKAVPNS